MALFASTIFLSAFLLFQIQPMIAKMILPWFGGSASVWITAMLFFQTALLCGYLYAHWSVRTLAPRMQSALHMLLLALSLFFLPIAPSPAWKPAGTEDPLFKILGLLTVSLGLPYFLLSSTSPLIQAWYARAHRTALPYRLFGLSNLASLLGLLAYPVFVEPNVTLHHQSLGWSAAFAVYAALAMASAFAGREDAVPGAASQALLNDTAETSDAPKPGERFFWLVLACSASTLLLAVTNHLTQNVASIPFLWVLPLSLYLLTFILVFDFERIYSRRVFLWLFLLALCAMAYGLIRWDSRTNIKLVIAVYAAGLFISCMFFHGELATRKPSPGHLTSFYLMLSIGGALGGLLVGVAAPRFLPAYFELPITLICCSALLLLILDYKKRRVSLALGWATAVVVIMASGYYLSAYGNQARVMARNFYGGLRVTEYDKGTTDEIRYLIHGTVTHGTQYTDPSRRHELISYYGPESGISLAVNALRRSPLRLGVIGLGAGSLAAYAHKGDVIRFYELNPLIEDLARREFTYLAACRGKADVVIGDGRLSLEREPLQNYDVLVADAFSGDAIPVHLLSRQALELYFRHMQPKGILALHITNTHLDLEPVVEKLAATLGKHAVVVSTRADEERNIYRSKWALLSSAPIASPDIRRAGKKLTGRRDLRVWTDDYNNLFRILK